ncbi:MAG: hypothetical protein ABW061_11515 [Polyangiaceae bacterium]
MMDSAMPAAAAKFFVALALVAGTSPARADEPAEANDSAADDAPAPATPAAEPARTSEPAPTKEAAIERPVIALPGASTAGAQPPATSWFAREPLALRIGEGDKTWSLTFYGFIEADFITDSTRSYDERISSSLVARSDTYEGHHGQTQFSIRNTRLGLQFKSPVTGGVSPSAVIETDFYGAKPDPSTTTTPEKDYYDAASLRVRHAYLLLENAYVDVLAGQTYNVFGWQNFRSTQFRLSHNFGAWTGPVTLTLAASVARPAQRDSSVPDANVGLRLNINRWQGVITTNANSGSLSQPMFLQVSAVGRQYKVDSFTPPPTQNSNSASAWGVSIDALLPVIPANDANDRGNRLTLTGSFVTGTGIGDLISANGGAAFPTLPNPAQANPPPLYTPDIDNGLVSFDVQGVLHTIDWRAVKVGLQYYLPPSGRLFLTANYTQAHSTNMAKLFPKGGAEIELLGRVADTTQQGDVNLYWDATPAVRFGLTGAYTKVRYLDGNEPHNLRGAGLVQYAF